MSTNVFADLELPNPEERQLKAKLVLVIRTLAEASKMTQTHIAERAGMQQPTVSRLMNGMTKDISVEKLFGVITALGQRINISFDPQAEFSPEHEMPYGQIHVAEVACLPTLTSPKSPARAKSVAQV